MREKGKAVETYSAGNFSEFNYSAPDFLCKRHPNSSSIGICAYCLKERLLNLVCSECGEQRLSSCSCSEVSSYRNSSVTDVGSVGRISFLIENEKQIPNLNTQNREEAVNIMLKRSSSSCVGVKRSGLWRIVRLFRKTREKASERKSVGGFDEEKSEMWVLDYMGTVSRSRSLCSFRGGSFNESSSDFAFSSAKISDFNSSSERVSNFSEAEPRKSSFENKGMKKCGFRVKESDFRNMDESAFIDLKLDSSSETRSELSAVKNCDFPVPISDFGNMRSGGLFRKGGSCRITVSETGIKTDRKGKKVWKWFLKHNPNWRSRSKKDESNVLMS